MPYPDTVYNLRYTVYCSATRVPRDHNFERLRDRNKTFFRKKKMLSCPTHSEGPKTPPCKRLTHSACGRLRALGLGGTVALG